MSKHSAAEEIAALQEDEQAEHRAVLRQRGFKAFLVARLGAVFAMQIQAVVVVWQIYDLTQNPLSLAYAGLAQFIPMLLLLLPAGDLVDRYRRKYILILSWLLQGLCSGLLWQLRSEERRVGEGGGGGGAEEAGKTDAKGRGTR